MEKQNKNNVNFRLGSLIIVIGIAIFFTVNVYNYFQAYSDLSSPLVPKSTLNEVTKIYLYRSIFYLIVLIICIIGFRYKKYQLTSLIALACFILKDIFLV